jgi:hypothetical protein
MKISYHRRYSLEQSTDPTKINRTTMTTKRNRKSNDNIFGKTGPRETALMGRTSFGYLSSNRFILKGSVLYHRHKLLLTFFSNIYNGIQSLYRQKRKERMKI